MTHETHYIVRLASGTTRQYDTEASALAAAGRVLRAQQRNRLDPGHIAVSRVEHGQAVGIATSFLCADGKRWHTGKAFAAALVLALTLLTTHGASAQPTDCYPVGTMSEGFPVVQCIDGSTWYRDDDGQIYENEAGYPVYPPGTWVQLPN